ncbi:ABC transporter permease [Nonomuraea dietziae]|uniref:ABC transporter permease n=1 Tax=Nonomuraea dietziae TaxID=65515 RepID=UPI0031E31AD3
MIACAFFSLNSPQFLTGGNFSLIIQQVMVVGTLAIGQTLIILTGGIDLSNGAIMAFGGIVMAKLALSMTPLLAIAAGLAAVRPVRVWSTGRWRRGSRCPPFIVTLGMLNVVFALTHIYSQDQTVTGLPDELTFLGQTFQLGGTRVTYGSVLTIALFLLFAYLLGQTAWGRHVYALGNSPEVARLTGIRTSRLTVGVYTLAGLVYGIAALLLVSRTGVGDPQGGPDRQPRQHHRRRPRRNEPVRRFAAWSWARSSARSSWACSATACS